MNRERASGALPLILFVVGAAATIALVALFAYAPDLRRLESSDGVAVSRSAIGFAGLNSLLNLSGVPTEIDRGQLMNGPQPSLTIVTYTIETRRDALDDFKVRGPLLVILPKWIVAANPLRPAWVMKTGASSPNQVAGLFRPSLTIAQKPGDTANPILRAQIPMLSLPSPLNLRLQQAQTITKGAPDMLDLGERERAVLVRVKNDANPVYVLSEPDLMNNQGLANESTARAALAIIAALRKGNGPVVLDVTLNGMGRSPSLLKALFEPPFRGATLCAVLAALLMAFHTLARFGAPVDETTLTVRGKKALAENTAELVRIMGRDGGMALRYVQAARDLALARLGARWRSPRQQDALLKTMERKDGGGESFSELAAEAARAAGSADLRRIAAKTYAWRRRVSGEH